MVEPWVSHRHGLSNGRLHTMNLSNRRAHRASFQTTVHFPAQTMHYPGLCAHRQNFRVKIFNVNSRVSGEARGFVCCYIAFEFGRLWIGCEALTWETKEVFYLSSE
jgi:hypothetical protein